MDMTLLMSFFFLSIVETITPGPTLALVLQTRTSLGRPAAFATVAGITLANIVWVVLAFFVVYGNARVVGEWGNTIVRNLGAAFLIYLASRRILSSALGMIAGQESDPPPSETSKKAFVSGFVAHGLNPLSATYYLAAFSVTVSGMPLKYAMVFGAIPVVLDLLLFSLLAGVNHPTFGHLPARLVRLFAGLFFVFLVGHVYSESRDQPNILVTPWTALLMLAGFLSGAIHEAIAQIGLRQKKHNKLLWRAVAVWSSWFSITALVGGFYTLIGGFGASAFSLPPGVEHRVRICIVIAAALAATLSFAKAIGELQDERIPAEGAPPAASQGWQTQPLRVGVVVVALLLATFLMLSVADFNVVAQGNP